MTETTTDTLIVTDQEIEKLNEARTILKEIADRARSLSFAPHVKDRSMMEIMLSPDAYDMGIIYANAFDAENGVFMTLNVISTYGKRPMTEEQVHNK